MRAANLATRTIAFASTAALILWLGYDLLDIGHWIARGEAQPGEPLLWAATAWLVLCIATRPLVAPVRPSPVTLLAVLVSAAALPLAAAFAPVPPRASAVGDGILLASAGLFAWSAAALGSSFTLLPNALRLSRRGPYRFVRHPMYLSYMIGGIGVVCILPHPMTAAAVLVEAVALLWRAKAEETLLVARLPGSEAYLRDTPWLLPYRRERGSPGGPEA